MTNACLIQLHLRNRILSLRTFKVSATVTTYSAITTLQNIHDHAEM